MRSLFKKPNVDQAKQWVQKDAAQALRDFRDKDLRYSYLIIGAMVVIGLIVNWLFAHSHGWTVWPFVLAAGILLYIHEAAERNGTGVPPLHVYGLFGGAIALWVIVMAVLSVTNPLILLVGIAWIGYICGKKYLEQREKDRLIEQRRADGCCIHCGTKVEDPNLGFCTECGQEPNPTEIQLGRIASTIAGANRGGHARAVLTKRTAAADAAAKERALLASRPRQSTNRRSGGGGRRQ
jgi:hypothetical protein